MDELSVRLCVRAGESGEMLTEALEGDATVVANAAEDAVGAVLQKLTVRDQIDWSPCTPPPTLIIGRDTRASSPKFVELLTAGAKAVGCNVVYYGLVTTPQLHWLVHRFNVKGPKEATVDAYYHTLSSAFLRLLGYHRDR